MQTDVNSCIERARKMLDDARRFLEDARQAYVVSGLSDWLLMQCDGVTGKITRLVMMLW